MTQEEISKIKLACLEQAKFQCQVSPSETLKVAKELFEWVMSIS
jgi:hypothetical protein